MQTVNIAELKNRLSHYLNKVKVGEEIVIRDRNEPIARLVPLGRNLEGEAELLSLSAAGKIRLGEGVIDESFWQMPAPPVASSEIRRAIEDERDGR